MTTAPDRLFAEMKGRMRTAFLTSRDLSLTDKEVGGIMVDYVNHEHFLKHHELISWLSVKRIAVESCLSVRAVKKARARLCQLGVISEVDTERDRYSPTTYRFSDQWAQAVAVDTKQRLAEAGLLNADKSTAGVHGETPLSTSGVHVQTPLRGTRGAQGDTPNGLQGCTQGSPGVQGR